MAVPFLVPPRLEAEVKEALTEQRLPWWDLSRAESAALNHEASGAHSEATATLRSHPCRYIALRNFLLWLWNKRRAAGWLSRDEARRLIAASGLRRVWCAEALRSRCAVP